MNQTCVIILGMHRSGTSALTGLLSEFGIDLGSNLYPAADDNEKGFFENIEVINLNNKILLSNNSSYDDFMFNYNIEKNFDTHVNIAIDIIKKEFSYSKCFAIKDPRLCITFPIWEKALTTLGIKIHILLPYRNPIEVAQSLRKRNNFSFQKSLLLWCKHFFLAELYSRKYKRLFLDFQNLIDSYEDYTKELISFLELGEINLKPSGFIEKELKHHNSNYNNLKDNIPDIIKKITQLMKNNELNFSESVIFDNIRSEFEELISFFYNEEIMHQLNSYNYEDITELDNLREDNILLSSITDIYSFNEEYYLNKYIDIKEAHINPSKHYYENGKNEGRYPNLYCEKYKINTENKISNDEKIYYLEKNNIENNAKISKLNQDILNIKIIEQKLISENSDIM